MKETIVDGVRHRHVETNPNQPKLYVVQNDIMKSLMHDNAYHDIYTNISVYTRNPTYFSADESSLEKSELINFDFYKYEHHKYLYSISFKAEYHGLLKIIGPVDFMTYDILTWYDMFLQDQLKDDAITILDGEMNKRINAHFYIKCDDPNIESFYQNFLTKDEKKFWGIDNQTIRYQEGYFYFVCTEIYEPVAKWYLVYCPDLPDITINQELYSKSK